MGFYSNTVLPCLINCACGTGAVHRQREKVVPRAYGKVLEIGMGSGLNLRHYDASQVEFIWGLEPSEGMRLKAGANVAQSSITVKWLDLPSEQIPLEDACVDSIVLTYTLCTIPDWQRALGEMQRVLKPSGPLLFCEHGEAPEANIQKWQHRINPAWRRIAGGCNLDRPIPSLIDSVFDIQSLEQGYIKGPKIAAYQYYGVATKRCI
ncbi:class I SAM-dependent methyltransferase [Arenicella xantha]|uniref:Methyltransferase family protein n=1 Tax=Arenicella xantha TaxID=644221 RepID=A0A395JM43_9GAMM|nr:class I SAM-dependent methyltransferase [Arenicella xantha]RBP51771.1 methyltransferase family protein [Arenicella xantha]